MKRPLTAIALLMCLVCAMFASCHSSKKVAKNGTNTVQATSNTATKTHADYSVATFNAEVDGITVAGQLRIAADSLLWMSLTKVIELGRAVATPDSVKVYSTFVSKEFAGNYADLEKHFGIRTSFAELQKTALADDAEAKITCMAQAMGYNMQVKITKREMVDRLSFPFRMPTF